MKWETNQKLNTIENYIGYMMKNIQAARVALEHENVPGGLVGIVSAYYTSYRVAELCRELRRALSPSFRR